MTQKSQLPPPPVLWAQENNILYLTICLEDCKDPIIDIEPQKIYFKGVGGTEKKMHELTINLYNEIVPNESLKMLKGRTCELNLTKKECGPYWPRLTKEETKAHWLKRDFNKWQDEDDSDRETKSMGKNKDLEEMFRKMTGLDGQDDPGSSKSYCNPFAEVGEDNEYDSDDEDLPDLID